MIPTCRICFEHSEQLLFPCNCRDPICSNCLKRWIEIKIENDRDIFCEVCCSSYRNVRIKIIERRHFLDLSLLVICMIMYPLASSVIFIMSLIESIGRIPNLDDVSLLSSFSVFIIPFFSMALYGIYRLGTDVHNIQKIVYIVV
jgi:hypothetical protein